MKRFFNLENIALFALFTISSTLIGYLVVMSFIIGNKHISKLSRQVELVSHELKTHSKPVVKSSLKSIKLTGKKVRTIILEESNTISIRGMVTSSSMAKAQQELAKKALLLGPEATIYLVMDTGGGSIFAGLDFIEFARAIKNPIVTITKFSASMGFQIVQHMGDRYILDTGVLMSHRASGGVRGQFDGELESRLEFYKDMFDRLELQSATRMGLDLNTYKSKIINEFWSTGFRSVSNKSADEVVRASCGETLSGAQIEAINTLFGTYNVTISKCPLIRGVLGIEPVGEHHDKESRNAVITSYSNPDIFLKEYVLTKKTFVIFGE